MQWISLSPSLASDTLRKRRLIHTYFLFVTDGFQDPFHFSFWHVVSAVGCCLVSSFCSSAASSEQLLNGQKRRNVPVRVKNFCYAFRLLKIAGDWPAFSKPRSRLLRSSITQRNREFLSDAWSLEQASWETAKTLNHRKLEIGTNSRLEAFLCYNEKYLPKI